MNFLTKYKALRFLDGGDRVFYYNKMKGYFVPALIQIPNKKDYELTWEEQVKIIEIQVSLGLDREKFKFVQIEI